MKRLTVLIDADDTIENLCEEWVKYLNEKYGTSVLLTDIKEWDIAKAFPTIPRDEVYEPLFNEDLWKRVTPLPGAVENIKKIMEDGHKVVIVTSSHPDNVSLKWRYAIAKYLPFLNSNDVIYASQKQLIKGDVMIDDAPHNLVGGDYIKLLYDAPHNQNFDTEPHYITRVHNWEEVYFAINYIANNS